MGDIEYRLQGVDLIDKRWESRPVRGPIGGYVTGAWELMRGTGLLPALPGFRVTRFERPGQHGESQAQYAPISAGGLPLTVRVYAIGTDPQMPDYQQVGDTAGVRVRMLQENINQLLFRTQIGGSGSKGYLELERRFSADGEPQFASGRITGSTEPEISEDYLFADYHLIFSIPTGTWYGAEQTITRTIPNRNTTYSIDVPMGTAPVWDALVAARPNSGSLAAGSRFFNDMDIGYRMAYETSAWWVMDTDSRMSGSAGNGTSPSWGAAKNNARLIAEHGRPQGSALLINPGIAGEGRHLGVVRARLSAPGEVRIRLRPRYF